jgi:predicted dehydrogenase
MSHNRREFLRTTAVIGAGYFVAAGVQAQESKSPNERVAMASIGIEGKGDSDSNDAARTGDMVAICDVDEGKLRRATASRFKKAKPYTDFRKMLDEMGKSIDAVTVSTPDHMHAPASLMAMRMGKHCFCQKPLTHTIYEARLMGQVAREKKLATQMGNQGTADDSLRRAAALMRAGAIGTVREIHIWTDRPVGWWPQGIERSEPLPCPKDLKWDEWLGVAPKRPYGKNYHPFAWRGWWDFGTGALGDIGCHAINMPFRGVDIRHPTSVVAETSGHNKDSFPAWSILTYEFAATAARPALKLVWYDGGKVPPAEVLNGKKSGTNGSLVIGEKGRIWGNSLEGGEEKQIEFPHSPGHFEEWVRAIKGGDAPLSNFTDYAGPLAEMVLLGNLAVWSGQKIEFDFETLKSKNVPGLERLIKPEYPKGYTLDV